LRREILARDIQKYESKHKFETQQTNEEKQISFSFKQLVELSHTCLSIYKIYKILEGRETTQNSNSLNESKNSFLQWWNFETLKQRKYATSTPILKCLSFALNLVSQKSNSDLISNEKELNLKVINFFLF